MLFDNIRLSLSELVNNKLRAFLTVLGITIGIAAVVLLLSLGQSVQDYVTAQFEGLGTNTIRISAIADENRRTDALTMDLAETLQDTERLPLIDLVMPQASGNYSVAFENNEFSVGVQGVTTDYPEIEGRTAEKGSFFSQSDVDSSAQVALIGVTTAENLFETADPVGQSIRIGSVVFQVIGVLNESGMSDDLVVIPITAFKARLNNSRTTTGESTVNTILVRAADVNQIDASG